MSLVVFLACGAVSVDYGLLVADANRMQRGVDAAALSAANLLCVTGTDSASIAYDQGQARALAVVVAARNGVTVEPNNITFPAFNKIRVPARVERKFFFAAAIGQRSGSVTRSASAGRIAVRGISHAVPLAMTTNDYNTYKDGTKFEFPLIRNQDTDFSPGTFCSLDLRPDNSGKSGAVFQDDLTDGYNGTVFIGQKIDNALNSDVNSQGAKLDTAMQDRIDDAAAASYHDTGSNYTYPNYPVGDRRIMWIIVADPNPLSNNNPTLTARFFVPVYVISTRSPGNKDEYVKMQILPSVTFDSTDPSIVLGDDSTPFTGPSAVTLLG